MTNMSSDQTRHYTPSAPASFAYRDMSAPLPSHTKEIKQANETEPPAPPGVSVEKMNEQLHLARAEAVAATEARLKLEYEAGIAAEAEKIRNALEDFQEERQDYFAKVEAEVVQLALAIAAKILHREAQVDPMLMAALVRVAIDKLHDGSSVSVRVAPAEAGKWRAFLSNPLNGLTIEIVEDVQLGASDCILETELGSANFSVDAQMKEVEQGFFDLLAQRPALK
jgi:flagellar biosynthesis/type III secretory pathway protein FliH